MLTCHWLCEKDGECISDTACGDISITHCGLIIPGTLKLLEGRYFEECGNFIPVELSDIVLKIQFKSGDLIGLQIRYTREATEMKPLIVEEIYKEPVNIRNIHQERFTTFQRAYIEFAHRLSQIMYDSKTDLDVVETIRKKL